MAREDLNDVIDQLADWVGVYGAHDTDEPRPGFSPELHCRACFVDAMRTRIMAAVEFDAIMARVSLNSTLEAVDVPNQSICENCGKPLRDHVKPLMTCFPSSEEANAGR